METRLDKLITMAERGGSEGERDNALRMLGKMVVEAGKVPNAADPNDPLIYFAARYARIKMERDDALFALFRLRSRLTEVARISDDLNNPLFALFGALDEDWRTVTEIEAVARRNGFTGNTGTLRKRADNLAAAGKIDVREGSFQPRAWRYRK